MQTYMTAGCWFCPKGLEANNNYTQLQGPKDGVRNMRRVRLWLAHLLTQVDDKNVRSFFMAKCFSFFSHCLDISHLTSCKCYHISLFKPYMSLVFTNTVIYVQTQYKCTTNNIKTLHFIIWYFTWGRAKSHLNTAKN